MTAIAYPIGSLIIFIIRLLVIADGVGGWKKYNVDPGEYSRELCKNISKYFTQYELSLKLRKTVKPFQDNLEDSNTSRFSESLVKRLLVKSANATKNLGSSTCAMLMLDKNTGVLYSAYLGDSIYIILRHSEKVSKFFLRHKPNEQKHNVRTPFQVGKKNGDNPNKSKTNTHKLIKNDLIVLATDGFWDHLNYDKILDILNNEFQGSCDVCPQELADVIAEKAYTSSTMYYAN